MSGITSGVGIFSGIDSASLISQLLAIESRPKVAAQQRLLELQTQQGAYLDINSTLLGLKSAADAFRAQNIFRGATASTSNAELLTATASAGATEGSFKFTVDRLVSTHQSISRGFTDQDTSGVGASSFSFELGGGAVTNETLLSELNGGAGVARGKFRITDSLGGSAVIDLSRAVTVDDLLNAVNGANGIDVSASVDGYGLKIADNNAGALTVADEFGFTTASSLNLTGSGVEVTSGQLLSLNGFTPLSSLNDGNGVSFGEGGVAAPDDFTVTARDGTSYGIYLGKEEDVDGNVIRNAATTIQDVIDRVADETGGHVVLQINAGGTGFDVVDTVGGGGNLTIAAAATGRSTAEDLGIDVDVAADTANGSKILAGINTVLGASLNGGAGVDAGDFNITGRDGTLFNVTFAAESDLAEIITAINDASTAAGANVTASINNAGNGIQLNDSTASGSIISNFIVQDAVGTAAADLNIETDVAGVAESAVQSGNLQIKYISNATLLSDLNLGAGIGAGTIRFTDASGDIASVDINAGVKTVHDLLGRINGLAVDVIARINDNGDGIIIEADPIDPGSNAIKVEDVTGSVASSLGILGEAEDPLTSNTIDGSFERVVDFETTDTLQDIVEKINSAGVGVDATILNAGSGPTPFKISFTSETTGRIGRFIVDTGGFDLGLNTLSRGEDSLAFYGAEDPADAVLVTSSTNTLDNLISGVTINISGASDEVVEVNVQRDLAGIETTIDSFVTSFNGALDRIDFHGRFDAETETRGVLLGDSTISNIKRRLLTTVQGNPRNVSNGTFDRLFQVGVKIGSGGQLEFDRDQFRSAYEQDPEGVEALFAAFEQESSEDTVIFNEAGEAIGSTPNDEIVSITAGVAEIISELSEQFTDSIDGTLTRRKNLLDTQIQLQEDRIEQFDALLEIKRIRLEQQFVGLEQALAGLQTQQAALGSLSAVTSPLG